MNDIKEFVRKEFSSRRAKKSAKFYKKLIYFYKIYPNTVLIIINKLHILGYWKDYLHLIKYTKDINHDISKHIIDILKNQLLDDIDNYKQNKQFSTLVKWLPRKKLLVGDINFTEKFALELFDNTFTYLSIIKNLSSKMNVAEIKICDKKIEEVDVLKMPELCYKKNINKLVNNQVTMNKVIERLNNIYQNMDFWEFVEKLCFKKYHDIEKKILNVIFNKRKNEFKKNLNFIDFNNIFWVDLSSNMFNCRKFLVVIGLMLLNDNKIIVNRKIPFQLNLNENVFDSIQTIKNNTNPCDKIYTEFYKNYDDNIMSVSSKIPNIITDKAKAFVITNSSNLKIKLNLIEWNPSIRNNVPKIRQDALDEIIKSCPKTSINKYLLVCSIVMMFPTLLFVYHLFCFLMIERQYYY